MSFTGLVVHFLVIITWYSVSPIAYVEQKKSWTSIRLTYSIQPVSVVKQDRVNFRNPAFWNILTIRFYGQHNQIQGSTFVFWLDQSLHGSVCMFVFRVFVSLEIFSLICRRYHYRWSIENWGFFNVPTQLWQGTSIYKYHLPEDP